MDHKLSWKKLLSDERMRKSKAAKGHRNAFELDYDRIVGSSSVRRLQDKAQVFPLQENDFTRTRLTHSLEVSALAKSLGKAVGQKIQSIDPSFDSSFDRVEELSSLLQTAGLIHDLGNPPFGHFGEDIIRKWFSDFLNNEQTMTENQKRDFLYFDGNVQNLRIVTKLQMLNDQFGVNFTCATLATIIKYPWASEGSETKPSKEKKVEKYGYYQSEKELVKEIWRATGLSEDIRHPATYLLEAADDIVYICDDIEDGVKKHLINWDDEYKRLKDEFRSSQFKSLFDDLDGIDYSMIEGANETVCARVHYFRNYTQGFMFVHAVDNFMENYGRIMNGEFGIKELIDDGEMSKFVRYLKGLAKKYCFRSNEVLVLELAGDKVIRGLLNIFVPALAGTEDVYNARNYSGKLYHIISENFRCIANFDYNRNEMRKFNELCLYEKLQLVLDYISGMTDSYAVNLYKELTGYKLP